MDESNSKTSGKKKNHVLRKLVGTVVVAGVVFAAKKIIASRKNKKRTKE